MKFQLRAGRFVPAFLATTLALSACHTTTNEIGLMETPSMSAQEHGADAMPPLPPGWTMEDMQACMVAGTPGPMHQKMLEGVGTWKGKSTMCMAPGMPPTESPAMCTITPVMDGRYTMSEYSGEIPGMGPFHGLGYNGYDNVSKRFVSTWLDNHSTGIMVGEGDLSADGKTMNWTFRYNCPIAKKQATMRQVEHYTGNDTMTLEMYGNDPKSGKEYQMMKIDLIREAKARN